MTPQTKKPELPIYSVVFGCDPEFFIKSNNKIVGSEKIIPKEGIVIDRKSAPGSHGGSLYGATKGKIIIDGVQAELNPRPDTCRARLGNEISNCFRILKKTMQEKEGYQAHFAQTVKITKKELLSLSKEAREFGCAPSKNINNKEPAQITVNATKYRYRSAGGHIHLSGPNDNQYIKNAINTPEKLVPVLDTILGNTCVLIDRDKGNKERRKHYGKAGEYRTPPHGIEYRTLSNFWLQSYPLTSFVLAVARLAVNIVAQSEDPRIQRDFYTELMEIVDIEKIRKAINTNNKRLAYANFKKIKPFLISLGDRTDNPFSETYAEAFEEFIRKDISHWFPEDPMEHWAKLPEAHDGGWETFISKIRRDMKKLPE